MVKARWKSWTELIFAAACMVILSITASDHLDKQEWLWAALNFGAMLGFYLMFRRAWTEI